jgi:hypothetical protein
MGGGAGAKMREEAGKADRSCRFRSRLLTEEKSC